ncbi:hypothetical protein RB195_018645 [Necator americanus]|uniref:Reverse transcriptase domain-containing protein n=1 Tax=Necator americanus TaxID=51031 RepID=A0ABR1CDN5_NECAM
MSPNIVGSKRHEARTVALAAALETVFIARRVIEIWQRYSKPMQLAFLDFEAAFDPPHRGRLLNALRAGGVAGKFVRLLEDMNQRTTAAIRTPVGYKSGH